MKKVLTGDFLMHIHKPVENREPSMADFQSALARYVGLS
jgi:hypothetical protein